MKEWEQKPSASATKTNYTRAKKHFEARVKAHNTYIQNSSSAMAGQNNYNNATNMANISDKIKDYIAKISSASITNINAV
jgi:hypothetical protein